MRTATIGGAFIVFLAAAVAGQDFDALYKEKLEKDFAKKIPWESSLEAAKAKAKAQNQLILGYFTRSYAP